MTMPDLQSFLSRRLSDRLSRPVQISGMQSVGGGSINETFRVSDDHGDSFFLKINDAARYPGLFNKERQGLEILQQFVRTPAVLLEEVSDPFQFMVLEWIAPGARTARFWDDFGTSLAGLHRQSAAAFGLQHDNYMGSLPQANGWRNTWEDFFREQRLMPQVKMAADNGLMPLQWITRFEQLYRQLAFIFPPEPPALLHGDLWSGNFICSGRQEPVLIDPAVYYGHRSVDLGMTTLFGRFDRRFYEAYDAHFPLPVNHEEQWEIANLYPLLIHLNLFGSSYLEGIVETVRKF